MGVDPGMSSITTQVPDEAAGVRAVWRATTMAEVWLRPGDWDHPAVDAVVEAVVEGRPSEVAITRLGFARGQAGVGLEEALDDVACGFRAASVELSPEAVRAAAVGWAKGQEAGGAVSGVRDAVRDATTGLPTADYVGERLRETYGAGIAEAYCLVVIDVGVDGLGPWERTARAAAVGQALEHTFGEGHPAAALSAGVYVVLCERRTVTPEITRATRRIVERQGDILGLADTLRRPTRVWVERLPASHTAAVDLLRTLGR